VAIIHEGRLVMEQTMGELRHAAQTLEEVFVRVVGAGRTEERLDWL
jgi:hypothetical protein